MIWKRNLSLNFDWKAGDLEIHSTLHTVKLFQYIGWTGKSLGSFAIHNWMLRDIDGKTEIFVEENMEGFLVKLLKRAFQKILEESMATSLEQLKLVCENQII